MEGHLPALLGPPGDVADRVQPEAVDGRVGVGPGPPVEVDDLLARLVRGRPHVRVRLGVLVEPRRRLLPRTAEGLAEVAELDAGDVLDQPEEVGAGRHHRPADVVLREPVELPQQGITGDLQVAVEVLLRVRAGHHDSLSPAAAPGGVHRPPLVGPRAPARWAGRADHPLRMMRRDAWSRSDGPRPALEVPMATSPSGTADPRPDERRRPRRHDERGVALAVPAHRGVRLPVGLPHGSADRPRRRRRLAVRPALRLAQRVREPARPGGRQLPLRSLRHQRPDGAELRARHERAGHDVEDARRAGSWCATP